MIIIKKTGLHLIKQMCCAVGSQEATSDTVSVVTESVSLSVAINRGFYISEERGEKVTKGLGVCSITVVSTTEIHSA